MEWQWYVYELLAMWPATSKRLFNFWWEDLAIIIILIEIFENALLPTTTDGPGVPNAAGAPIKPKVPGIPRTPWAQPLLQEQLSLLLAKQAIHENCQELRIFYFLQFS